MIGGYNKGPQSTVEAFNIGLNRSCLVPSLPKPSYGHSSAATPIGIVVCGGETHKKLKGIKGHAKGHIKTCYRSSTENQWGHQWVKFRHLRNPRAYFSMKYLNGKLWAIGGEQSLNTIEFIDVNNPAEWIVEKTPFSIFGQCLTELPNNRFLLTGGNENKVSRIRITETFKLYGFFKFFIPLTNEFNFSTQT